MNRTLALIKPDAVDRNIIGEIITLIEQNGFIVRNMKFNIIALILEKDNAVKLFRDLIGSTDPQLAEEGTIRKLYAIDKSFNSVHGSDSDANAEREIAIIFNY